MGMNLEKMTRNELLELRANVDVALKAAERRDRKEALEAAQKAAAEFGFSLSELSDGSSKSLKLSKTKEKYRNPSNHDQTWSGRGRKPHWVHEALKAGADISDMEI
ncbi:H-NS family nucleoid-associated regulatory protein [Ruegeria faecimaris]|uniref:DNA-binding protein H-NS n=1 Tax=Ruegeria faecimaris TaxID=686389 RepID=A0A521C6H3_9RHOB|nr:H-NS histone family protein [Ruegeria faecimaris]SMO54993.1 DNA-binding protein H-NS [Ruegeria faecimaris]